jgi:dUTP pyrophosphatase
MSELNFIKNAVLKYHKLYGDVEDLKFATRGSACVDVRAYFGTHERLFKVYDKTNKEMQYMAFQLFTGDKFHTVLNPGDRALVPTGIVLDIPRGYSVRVHPRSGLSFKTGLTLSNCEGVIDWDYVEQLYISICNSSQTEVRIDHGDRIAQLELVKLPEYNIELINERPSPKTDRSGGFGSTGKQ